MTVLTLVKAAIAPISDLSDVLLLQPSDISEAESTLTQVRRYAGGVRRVVSAPGSTRTISLAWRHVDRADYVKLKALTGVSVLFRDTRARAVFGVFASVNGSEWRPDDKLSNVTATIEEITYSEVV
jgi:hypothetical protein